MNLLNLTNLNLYYCSHLIGKNILGTPQKRKADQSSRSQSLTVFSLFSGDVAEFANLLNLEQLNLTWCTKLTGTKVADSSILSIILWLPGRATVFANLRNLKHLGLGRCGTLTGTSVLGNSRIMISLLEDSSQSVVVVIR